jgi:hypothetical protein
MGTSRGGYRHELGARPVFGKGTTTSGRLRRGTIIPLYPPRFVCSFWGMTRRGIRIAFLAAATLLTAGCGSRTNIPPAQSDSGQPTNFQLVTDIPIPSDATMDNERSLILSDRDHWTGRVVMRFWQNPAELTAFYQSQMPAFGWEPLMSVTSDISVLSYTRGDRAATVQIEKSMLGMTSVVSVTVAPRQSNGGAGMGGGSGGGASAYPPAPTSYDSGPAQTPVKTETLGSPNRR